MQEGTIMTMRSNDSQNKLHFRSDRIACENGQFFFSTREGALNGPYNTRHQAEVAASLFIRDQLDPHPSGQQAESTRSAVLSLQRAFKPGPAWR